MSEPTDTARRGPLGALPSLSPTARRALAWCALLSVGQAAALVACAWALSGAVAAIVSGGPLGDRPAVLAAGVAARALLAWASRTVSARAAAGTKEDLRARLLDAATARGPEWIARRGPAELTALATRELDALDGWFTRFLPALVDAVVVVPLVGLAILLADWSSALLIVVTVPLVPLFAALIGRFTATRTTRAADAGARLAAHLLELLRALPVLAAFGRAGAQERAIERASDAHRRAAGGALRVAFLSALVLDLLATLSVALVAVDVGLRLVSGGLTLATALLVLVLAPECYLPLRAAGAAYHASEDGLAAVARVAEAVRGDGVGAEGGPVPKGVRPDHLRHQLHVSGLRVARRGGYAPDGLTVSARAGSVTRLDAPSGAGKSTVFAVLLGFARPESGSVTVGGTELSTLDPMEWRRSVAWVPQSPRFTARLVADELRSAVSDSAPATDEELAEVAAEAAAGHLLDRPTARLSAGERQRVAVARALLRLRRGAWLLLLDEPTAHLDPVTAAHVSGAIRRAADAGAAVLLATHAELAEPDSAPEGRAVAATDEAALTVARAGSRELLDRRSLAGVLLGAAALGSAVALTGTAAWLIATAAGHPPILTLSVAIVAVRAFGLGKGALRYAERLVSHDAAFRLAGRLRARLWRALVRLGPVRTDALRRADGLRRLLDDTDTVRDLVPRVLTPPLTALLVGTAAVAVSAALLPAAGVALAVALLVAGGLGPVAGLLAERRATAALARGRRELSGAVLDLLDGAAELVAHGAHAGLRADLAARDAELTGRARRQAWGAGVAAGIATAALGAASLAAVWLSAGAVAAGHLPPVLAAVLALLPLALAETVDGLAPAVSQLDPLRAAHGRITALATASTPDDPAAEPSPDGRVELAGVAVAWPGAEPVLTGVDLAVPAGAEVAVVGPSGAGKSTLLALLLGFLPPIGGRALVPADVAWAPPEPGLAATTVRENLRLGDPEAGDDELRAALSVVALEDWTDRLDTRLGAGGTDVSGGQARRLALARALLRAPHAGLVLLDEPTAHLDRDTAARVLGGLRSALAGHTVVHVTHRTEDAAGADLVVRVDGGRVTVHRPRPAEAPVTEATAVAGRT